MGFGVTRAHIHDTHFPSSFLPGAREARTGYSQCKVVTLSLALTRDNANMWSCNFLSKGRQKFFVTGQQAEESRQHAARISGKGKAVLVSDTF